MNPKLLNLLGGNEAIYPHVLEAKFPRVFNQILELWETPQIDPYLQDLLMNSRDGDRAGFPPEAAKEIFRLGNLASELHRLDQEINVWGDDKESQRKQVVQSGYEFTPHGFLKAVGDSNVMVVQKIIACGVNLEVRDERNWTALMIASSNGAEELALLLIKSGARIDARDTKGYTALHWAAFNGHASVVKMLLEQGLDANTQSQFGWTALIQAATRGHLVACAYLLAKGADVNLAGSDGSMAHHKAANSGHVEVVKLLLDKGANRHAAQKDGSTPLDLALKSGYESIVALLQQPA